MAKRNYTVFELTLKLKYDWNRLDRRDLTKINKGIKRWLKVAKFGGKMVGILIVTNETSKELMKRMIPVIDGITSIEDFWIQTASRDAVGRNGSMCPFQSYIVTAWKEASDRNKPKKVRKTRPKDVFLKHGVDFFNRQKSVKSGFKPRGDR